MPLRGFCQLKALDQLRLWLWVVSGWRCQQGASEEAVVGPGGAAGLGGEGRLEEQFGARAEDLLRN